ncbi:Alpha/beta hydrolase family protein [Maioricimonas rarisocia]|uniref:Alpha/beta hydrolase family protein n=1 Tax=Maioricimonas rarisocia TaxID=2528026 RepID=A0A517ZAL5_9PLAN|nr:alpha/beta hydrolase [Maioricimonas rarisocia]QDU39469.1 Alpha/beta hydrolase family protein [Maioricimonas rarisocia]
MNELLSAERLDRGYVIILPGIEGRSWCNRSIARGLAEAGLPYGIEIYDWTLGPLAALYTLRASWRHRRESARIAEKLIDYRSRYPDRPMYLVGHSGGGGMSVLTLQQLPDDVRVEAAVLLAPAISPKFPLDSALQHVERGIWNFYSYGDAFFVGLMTTVLGTMDAHHMPAAGFGGFHKQSGSADPRLHEVPFEWSMTRHWNLGGHFGCVNHRFVRTHIAPILAGQHSQPDA